MSCNRKKRYNGLTINPLYLFYDQSFLHFIVGNLAVNMTRIKQTFTCKTDKCIHILKYMCLRTYMCLLTATVQTVLTLIGALCAYDRCTGYSLESSVFIILMILFMFNSIL